MRTNQTVPYSAAGTLTVITLPHPLSEAASYWQERAGDDDAD